MDTRIPHILAKVAEHVSAARERLEAVALMHRRGLIDLSRPHDVLRIIKANRIYGAPTAALMNSARTNPDVVAVWDQQGALTFRDLDRSANRIANSLERHGITAGTVIGVLARDHRGLPLTITAAARIGARVVILNTGMAEPQLHAVIERENVRAIFLDSEFTGLFDRLSVDITRILTDSADPTDFTGPSVQSLADLCATGNDDLPHPPKRLGGFVLLTSGTTGTPKGAPRKKVSPFVGAMFLSRMPIEQGGCMVIAAPLFHATGFGMWTIGSALANTTVLVHRFNAEEVLRSVDSHRATMLILVPTMLQRILALPDEVVEQYDTASLRIVVVAGAPLTRDLTTRAQRRFGKVLYNIYGSTEAAIASIATPAELQQSPGSVGRAPLTARIMLFDDNDQRITKAGRQGRIFVRSAAPFEGYTDGRNKLHIGGYMSTGDNGHFDDVGLLHIDGREDDMIVSGGENVYPNEIENLLGDMHEVEDVAVVGVDDVEFGTRLRAVVVAVEGAHLTADMVRSHVRSNLARYKVPRDVIFTDALPRNATGKVLRNELPNI
ncbi:AMP-binding protein [Rhodococcus erythropolis]|uniref:AMP-binding protein n=1 Tax=Rhodococcus erythropolis TaxID=1833 RepID=UPI001E394748|nr:MULTISPECIES: AMP-binding protein [Rhodococcus erythropolis group]MCD2104593.1 AMP-binding protein [Rhodococcus qingshengii]MCZ4525282.1 AMP-binding protein [Rhodococcus erythropolis]